MYSKYIDFIKTINYQNSKNFNFKNNQEYTDILEHVTNEQGKEYLNLIQSEFTNITEKQIIDYITINDMYGFPNKTIYELKNNRIISCSPTSLRYIYHALLILKHYKTTNTKDIVEVGCGYGGLFLAICFFSKILNIEINKYYFIDLPEVCNLIKHYLILNKDNITIEYEFHESDSIGKNINNNNLFFVSNYCFTEIDMQYRNNYINYLFPKCKNGFVIWQTIFGYNLQYAIDLFKNCNINEEKPQTANETYKNYFVLY
jgi:hypothetical protein